MSSSQRKSPNRKRSAHGDCPTCGNARVVSTVEDVVLTVHGRKHRFENIPHEKCLNCGERIFGIEASHLFDAALHPKKRSRAA